MRYIAIYTVVIIGVCDVEIGKDSKVLIINSICIE